MSIRRPPPPEPKAGLVIRYAYLWRSEADTGREEGIKDRPCAIVLATVRQADSITVVVAPITHTQPGNTVEAVEIPAATKARLGLDAERSWVVTNDLNYFTWPGPDVRPVDAKDQGRGFAYGQLPASLTRMIIDNVRERIREGRANTVGRDEQASTVSKERALRTAPTKPPKRD